LLKSNAVTFVTSTVQWQCKQSDYLLQSCLLTAMQCAICQKRARGSMVSGALGKGVWGRIFLYFEVFRQLILLCYSG